MSLFVVKLNLERVFWKLCEVRLGKEEEKRGLGEIRVRITVPA
jgi:hypothetical protein